MKGFRTLKKTAQREAVLNSQERFEFAAELQEAKKLALDDWYSRGGVVFQQWAKQEYLTSDGNRLSWNEPFMEQMYLFIGHPWFSRKVVEKAAQVGFTESLIAYLGFCLTHLHLPIGFGAETRDKIYSIVGNRIQPALDFIPAVSELNQKRQALTKRKDSDNKKSISVAGVDANFFYANKMGKAGGMDRQASSSLSSFTAGTLACDELELWAPGVLDVATKRMQASRLPTKPIIAGSTPGAEGGVTATEVKLASYLFQWFLRCDRCGLEQFLSPLGNLLKSVEIIENDRKERRYTSPTGRPLDWYYHQGMDRVKTAYVGCKGCSEPLTPEAIASGSFVCQNTKVSLKDLIKETTVGQFAVDRVAIRLPRLANGNFSASEIIDNLLTSANPIDDLQQGLGVPASVSLGRIDYNRLIEMVGVPVKPDYEVAQTFTVLAVDQGKFSHPAVVEKWYLPALSDRSSKAKEAAVTKAHKEIIWYGELANLDEAITQVSQRYDCDFVVMDSEPEYSSATAYALAHQPKWQPKNQVYLIDQVRLKGEKYRRKVVKTSNADKSKVVLYSIDRTFFCDRVRDRIYQSRLHFPPGIVYDPKDKEHNLLAHFLSSERLPDGKWQEGSEADHFFMASSMSEFVMLAHWFEKGIARFRTTTIRTDYQPFDPFNSQQI